MRTEFRRRLPVLWVSVVLAACGPPGEEVEPERVAAPGGVIGDAAVAQPVEHRVTTVVEGLEHPWGLAFLPGEEGILVTERSGRLRLVRGGQLEAQPIAGLPEVWARGQGGLLDIALHPDFASNRLVYLSYSKPGPRGATTAVARGRLEQDRLTAVQDVFVADAWGTSEQHFGARIVFDRQGYLFVTIGERGQMDPAQDVRDHVGTTVRLHDDGRVPQDNPFVGRPDARDEIFSYGHRNAQGMAVHPGTGEIWQNEHGPRGGDELNRIVPGGNYGWPEYSFGNHYDGRPIPEPTPEAGIEMPLVHWTPAIAPSGMAFYTGNVFPQWRDDAFVGSLVGQHLRRIRFDATEAVEQELLLEGSGHRIRDVRVGPDGLLYVLVDAPSAPLLRLEPAGE